MPYLVVENGPLKGTQFPIRVGGKLLFGRDPRADISINDHLCSRRQFLLEEKGGAFLLSDLGSSNGTFVNDERLRPNQALALSSGDALRAGETLVTFLDDTVDAKGLAGKEVGGYRIVERIGRGGMGTVFKALQTSLGRVVALKILNTKLGHDPAFVDRFQREARAAGRLNHPNIVQVYDVGSDKEIQFFSMEFMDNGSVQDLADREGTLDLELAITIVLEAARGLEYAEKRGLVHRDIKPDNLMINGDGVVKIADLGLARATDEAQSHEEDGTIFGTPHFIAPEQALGKKVDTRSDIYSLGATFYRLLAGRTPFSAEEEGVRDILRKQVQEDPQSLREIDRSLPSAVVAIVEKMMRKSPDERFQTASDLVAALEAAERGLEHRARPRALKWVSLALAVISAGAIAFAVWPKGRGPIPDPVVPPPASRTTQPTEENGEQSVAEQAAARQSQALIAFQALQLDELRLEGRTESTLKALIARYRDEIATPYSDVAQMTESVRTEIARLEAEIAALTAAAAAREQAREEADRQVDALVSALHATVDAETAKDRFGAALAATVDAAKHPSLAMRAELSAVLALVPKIQSSAGVRTEALLEEAAGMVTARRFSEASALLDGAIRAYADQLPEDADSEPIQGLLFRLRTMRDGLAEAQREGRRSDLANDQKVAFETRRGYLVGLTRALQPEVARAACDGLARGVKTPEWKRVLADDADDLAALARVKAAISAFRPGPDDKIRLPNPREPGRLLDWDVIGVSEQGIELRRARTEKTLVYSETSLAAYESWFLDSRLERIGVDPADLLRGLLVTGAATRAKSLIASGLSAPPELSQRVAREAEAEALLADLRTLERNAAQTPELHLELLPLAERLLQVHGDSRAFARNSDGTTPRFPLR